ENPLYFIQKKQKSKTSFTGAFDFLVQKGLMGQPLRTAGVLDAIDNVWLIKRNVYLSDEY
ncbi:hypothetical protein, partial [Staphylococcus aureus]|uniref:hypothetical protein n=1 Tax=Staphylococcus aureus TaxID=1280 RepID=UPI001E5083AA